MQRRIREYTQATLPPALAATECPFFVHFGTDWCTPCKRLERVLGELAVDWGDTVLVGKVNVEDEPELAKSYAITRNPTLCLFRAGQLVVKREGFSDKAELLALLQLSGQA